MVSQLEFDSGLSPAATTVAFDRSVPPARVPVPAGPADDPDRGPYLLAFADDDACQKSWSHSEGLFYERCQMGARMSCSRAALRKCQPQWWRRLPIVGRHTEEDAGCQRDCEDKEIVACLAASSMECQQMAAEYCGSVYHRMLVANHPDLVPSQLLPKSQKSKKSSATNPTAYVETRKSAAKGDPEILPNHDSTGRSTSSVRLVKPKTKSKAHVLEKPERRTANELGGHGDPVSEKVEGSAQGGFVGGWIKPKKCDNSRDGNVSGGDS